MADGLPFKPVPGHKEIDQNHVTGVERRFPTDEIIVSKTDRRGWITYANDVFISIAGYSEAELLGAPHSIIRHPHMPRCVFKLLWDTIDAGDEIFAYVVNRCKNGDHYWVYAHVTPNLGADGRIVGYHSNRRTPRRDAVATVTPLYRALCAEETRHADPKRGLAASEAMLNDLLRSKEVTYERFVLAL